MYHLISKIIVLEKNKNVAQILFLSLKLVIVVETLQGKATSYNFAMLLIRWEQQIWL